jgi:hypothetical protein
MCDSDFSNEWVLKKDTIQLWHIYNSQNSQHHLNPKEAYLLEDYLNKGIKINK